MRVVWGEGAGWFACVCVCVCGVSQGVFDLGAGRGGWRGGEREEAVWTGWADRVFARAVVVAVMAAAAAPRRLLSGPDAGTRGRGGAGQKGGRKPQGKVQPPPKSTTTRLFFAAARKKESGQRKPLGAPESVASAPVLVMMVPGSCLSAWRRCWNAVRRTGRGGQRMGGGAAVVDCVRAGGGAALGCSTLRACACTRCDAHEAQQQRAHHALPLLSNTPQLTSSYRRATQRLRYTFLGCRPAWHTCGREEGRGIFRCEFATTAELRQRGRPAQRARARARRGAASHHVWALPQPVWPRAIQWRPNTRAAPGRCPRGCPLGSAFLLCRKPTCALLFLVVV